MDYGDFERHVDKKLRSHDEFNYSISTTESFFYWEALN